MNTDAQRHVTGSVSIAMKTFLGLVAALSAFSSVAMAAPSVSRLLVPGHSVGQLHLGPNGTAELKRLPKAQASDAGMSQNRLVWVSRSTHNTLFVHTVANGALDVKPLSGVTISEINVTSPYYRTSSGVGSGSTLAQIKRAYPRLHLNKLSNGSVIYDELSRGIAFEFPRISNSARCVGVTVYTPGNKPASGGAISIQNVKSLLLS